MSRSQVVRIALRDFLERYEAREREERDLAAISKHRAKLEKQLEALVESQAEA